ncbi:spermidine synthase [Chitinivorax tropicus]|uniref:Spermidine synthase n=1 Tax=Chitinivorax tropicus TaxID=714531 RepID=A0A840MHW6_9PROT|nr:polyamine aminopropyltransferase [Chitinivorax tropicus]MBB5017115.1 spermidine synthase [Chitinivorax tropicus]
MHKSKGQLGQVDVSEEKGIRSLHLGSITVQSSMKVSSPDELVLEYTRCMMGFLLFCPPPQRAVTIGLGGGSVVKWIHRYLPMTHNTVVEINPQIVQVARSMFFVPNDDEQLQILIDDGANYIAGRDEIADVILVDGYDGYEIVEQLNTEAFYQHCRDALTESGVLVVNLWGNHRLFDTWLQRIERVFEGHVACLPAQTKGNVAIFAFKRAQGNPKWVALRDRARNLEQQYGLEFPVFVSQLGKLNMHSDKRLLI